MKLFKTIIVVFLLGVSNLYCQTDILSISFPQNEISISCSQSVTSHQVELAVTDFQNLNDDFGFQFTKNSSVLVYNSLEVKMGTTILTQGVHYTLSTGAIGEVLFNRNHSIFQNGQNDINFSITFYYSVNFSLPATYAPIFNYSPFVICNGSKCFEQNSILTYMLGQEPKITVISNNGLNFCGDKIHYQIEISLDSSSSYPVLDLVLFSAIHNNQEITNIKINGYSATSLDLVVGQYGLNSQGMDPNIPDLNPGETILIDFDCSFIQNPISVLCNNANSQDPTNPNNANVLMPYGAISELGMNISGNMTNCNGQVEFFLKEILNERSILQENTTGNILGNNTLLLNSTNHYTLNGMHWSLNAHGVIGGNFFTPHFVKKPLLSVDIILPCGVVLKDNAPVQFIKSNSTGSQNYYPTTNLNLNNQQVDSNGSTTYTLIVSDGFEYENSIDFSGDIEFDVEIQNCNGCNTVNPVIEVRPYIGFEECPENRLSMGCISKTVAFDCPECELDVMLITQNLIPCKEKKIFPHLNLSSNTSLQFVEWEVTNTATGNLIDSGSSTQLPTELLQVFPESGDYEFCITASGVNSITGVPCISTQCIPIVIDCPECSIEIAPYFGTTLNCDKYRFNSQVNLGNGTQLQNYIYTIKNSDTGQIFSSTTGNSLPSNSWNVTIPQDGNYEYCVTIKGINPSTGEICEVTECRDFVVECNNCEIDYDRFYLSRGLSCSLLKFAPVYNLGSNTTLYGYKYSIKNSYGQLIEQGSLQPNELDDFYFSVPRSDTYKICLTMIGQSLKGELCEFEYCNDIRLQCSNCEMNIDPKFRSESLVNGCKINVKPNVIYGYGTYPDTYVWEVFNSNFQIVATGNGNGTPPNNIPFIIPNNLSNNGFFVFCIKVNTKDYRGNPCPTKTKCINIVCGTSTYRSTNINLGIAEENLNIIEDKISVYPNPSNGVFNITSTDDKIYTIQVYDVMGKIIYDEENSKLNNYKLDLSHLRNGVYLIKCSNQEVIKTIRVIKK